MKNAISPKRSGATTEEFQFCQVQLAFCSLKYIFCVFWNIFHAKNKILKIWISIFILSIATPCLAIIFSIRIILLGGIAETLLKVTSV